MRSAHEQVLATAAASARDRALIAARRGEPMEQGGDQVAALLDVVRSMAEAAMPYAVIGGIAVAVQSGQVRATIDIDIAVRTSVPRTQLVELLKAAGFTVRGEFPHSVNFRHPSGEPVQVAFDETFDAMIDRAEQVEVADTIVCIVTKDDLIASKERAARDPGRRRSKALQDQADVELLRGDAPDPDEGW